MFEMKVRNLKKNPLKPFEVEESRTQTKLTLQLLRKNPSNRFLLDRVGHIVRILAIEK
jgi:hypothetical protein